MKKIFQFFKETWQRLRAESPSYFQILQWIGGVAAAITGIPGFLQAHGLELPPALLVLENKMVAIAALVLYFVAKLTVKDPSKITSSITGEQKK